MLVPMRSGSPGAARVVVGCASLPAGSWLGGWCGPGNPVPVILPIASWDPAERLDSWMARRIAETYSDDRTAALVATRKVLPVLDGLDEMAEPSRTAAVRAINRWLPRDEPSRCRSSPRQSSRTCETAAG
ncbi:hypothetical protein ACIGNX_22630 [Actinosynnema sp. NPDC053489]|uniref:hypothetical protein n=1 Tax=Actinosynnema sp. NPDC053489 TaxID=3363916 RepID=UPI0037CCBDD1